MNNNSMSKKGKIITAVVVSLISAILIIVVVIESLPACKICGHKVATYSYKSVSGGTWKLCEDCYDGMTNPTYTYSKGYSYGGGYSNNTFTNKFGTPTTKCAHSGCNNYIASSGNTNCCTVHSNKCAECRCYTDEDALFCLDCLENALDKLK